MQKMGFLRVFAAPMAAFSIFNGIIVENFGVKWYAEFGNPSELSKEE